MKKYESYAEQLPEETRLIVATLHSSIRQAILVLLKQNEKLSFSIIKDRLGLDKLTLNYHLKKLYSSGLIDHYFERELGNKEYSYYSITKLGERFLSGLTMLLIPEVPFERLYGQVATPNTYELVAGPSEPCLSLYWKEGTEKPVTVTAPSCTLIGSSSLDIADTSPTDRVQYTKSRLAN
jgi:DNA-binding transcriptional ArsR family regulator